MYLRAQLRSKMSNKRYHYWHEHLFAMRIWLVWIGQGENVCALALTAQHALQIVCYVLGLRRIDNNYINLSNWLFPEHTLLVNRRHDGQMKGNESLLAWCMVEQMITTKCQFIARIQNPMEIKWEPDVFLSLNTYIHIQELKCLRLESVRSFHCQRILIMVP